LRQPRAFLSFRSLKEGAAPAGGSSRRRSPLSLARPGRDAKPVSPTRQQSTDCPTSRVSELASPGGDTIFRAQVPFCDFRIPSSVNCRHSEPSRLRVYPPDVDIRRAIKPAAGVRPRTGVPAQRSTAPVEHYKETTYDQSELAHRHLLAGLVVHPNIAIVLFPTYSFLGQRHHPASLAALLSAGGSSPERIECNK
jgi:hypothetical protein